jgi:hypothetical protein
VFYLEGGRITTVTRAATLAVDHGKTTGDGSSFVNDKATSRALEAGIQGPAERAVPVFDFRSRMRWLPTR